VPGNATLQVVPVCVEPTGGAPPTELEQPLAAHNISTPQVTFSIAQHASTAKSLDLTWRKCRLNAAVAGRRLKFVSARESVAVVVAHPDDETLWAGGTLLMQRSWQPFVASACRASDTDRAPKFFAVLELLGAHGKMADLDDAPAQAPLADELVEQAVLNALPERQYDRILTHSPQGEYTRHRRHEEVSRAVLRLWARGELSAPEVWLFAYEDGEGKASPRAISGAHIINELPFDIWRQKKRLLIDGYGFPPESWEARVTPQREAFFCVRSQAEAEAWLGRKQAP